MTFVDKKTNQCSAEEGWGQLAGMHCIHISETRPLKVTMRHYVLYSTKPPFAFSLRPTPQCNGVAQQLLQNQIQTNKQINATQQLSYD